MPCNFHLRRLSERVKAGIRAAGGTPIEYNTIAVSDGISMGTEGMKASLISREVIADSIELVARGHLRITSYNVCYTKLLRFVTTRKRDDAVEEMSASDQFDRVGNDLSTDQRGFHSFCAH